MPKTYIAIYEQDAVDDGWTARIDAVPGCHAQARSLPSVQARLREALGWRVGEDPASVIIEDRMPPAIAAVAKRANRARREADRAVGRAQQEVASAAQELSALGLSRRDSAVLLGLSRQRIQQLVEAGKGRACRREAIECGGLGGDPT